MQTNTQSRPIVQASREVRSHCLRVQWESSGFLFEGWRGFGDATVVVSFFFFLLLFLLLFISVFVPEPVRTQSPECGVWAGQ